jgi:N-acetylmuramic acid 6-phosphate etherase
VSRPSPRAYAGLLTERPNPKSKRIDTKSTRQIVALLATDNARVPSAVRRESARVCAAVDVIAASLSAGGKLVFIGAGTSGRLGIIEAAECPPTFSTSPALISAIMAGGRSAVFKSKEGAEDDAVAGARAAKRAIAKGDVLVGIAASGVTPFVGGALRAARQRGARTVLVTSAQVKPAAAQIVISVKVGPEILAGSTRLKSATAAKSVLNTLTTASMIRLGKVYDQWMVDLKPSSYKLRRRALRILRILSGVPESRGAAVLRRAGGNVKTAIAMQRCQLSLPQARRELKAAGGSLRQVLESHEA